ncbi:hypothetical protein COR50_16035 [Chitinophaga caeni]|uniref:histidine kinase n=1 Tax=Chitinophaga caeni TaxID=2029983 RepID=A0A291QWZ4_9BACT|nr:response regulator [Chitinophaga caeni]ATL48549.1 hypothetical protein COR50_16035 [Chitinophaga caeni]
MFRLSSIYKAIVNSDNEEEEEARRNETVNLIAMLCAVLVTVYGYWFYCLSDSVEILIPAMMFCPLFLFSIALNKHRKHLSAKILLQVVFYFVIAYYGITLGKLAYVQLLSLFAINIILLTFNNLETRWMIACIGIHLCIPIFLEFNYYNEWFSQVPLSEATQDNFRWLIISVVFFLNVLAICIYQLKSYRLGEKVKLTQEELDRKNRELEDKNVALVVQVADRTEQLDHANKALVLFLKQVAHETRNSLNGIIGQSTLLKEISNKEKLSDTMQEYVDGIYFGSITLSTILNNVISISEIESGHHNHLKEAPLNLDEWVTSILKLNRPFAVSQHVTLATKIAPDLAACIVIDQVKLTQIVNNLVAHGIKISPKLSTILFEVFRSDTKLCIRITDEGEPLNLAQIDALFKPLHQVDKNSEYFVGSKLGLLLARQYVELMGGKIYVNTNDQKGTTFTISLPLNVHEEEITVNEEPNIFIPAGKKILLVEDDKINRMIIERYLLETPIILELAENGVEGVEKAESFEPDLVLMDMNMPIMGGLEAIEVLRGKEKFKNLLIVALSANGFAEHEAEAKALGVNNYILKPVLKPQLFQTISKMFQLQALQTPSS